MSTLYERVRQFKEGAATSTTTPSTTMTTAAEIVVSENTSVLPDVTVRPTDDMMSSSMVTESSTASSLNKGVESEFNGEAWKKASDEIYRAESDKAQEIIKMFEDQKAMNATVADLEAKSADVTKWFQNAIENHDWSITDVVILGIFGLILLIIIAKSISG